MVRLVFTCGDINGIGPEICIKTISKIYNPRKRQIIFLCPQNVFKNIIRIIPNSFPYKIIDDCSFDSLPNDKVIVIDIGKFKLNFGKPTKDSGSASFNSIVNGISLVKSGIADALITAPISKTAFKLAGINYAGHTELLAEKTDSKNHLMIFLSNKMKCGLVTIHSPIKTVPRLINQKKIVDAIKLLKKSLEDDLGITNPKIAILGLNPHAGEDGNISHEEKEIIEPSICSLKKKNITGPHVSDAFFGNHLYKKYDAVLGMYHDQVLIPFKMISFNSGVNFTAGLPIVRTSPDHGTAFDIAGLGMANPSSMIQAVKWAEIIFSNRLNN
jgi:4-hydroxythreonine-4-phosphate dehydrogenase